MSDREELAYGYASILLDEGIDKPLDYQIPEELRGGCKTGIRVSVPLRGKPKKGTILTLKEKPEIASVQNILALLSEKPAISPTLFALAEWMSKYYCTALRRVFKVMMPPGMRKETKKKSQLFVRSLLSRPELASFCEEVRSKHPQQAAALDILLMNPKGMLLTELLEKAEISQSPLQTLIKKKILHTEAVSADSLSPIDEQEVFATRPKQLRDEQRAALTKIQASIQSAEFAAHLLFGVTGSGKTEVYIQAMDQALALGKGVIFLVPEILLTSQTLERIRTRFSEKVALLHHRLSDGERHDSWQKIQNGDIRIVMGARSALFSPMPNLGLIIVDEEHESSYKQQEEMPTYHARDVALMRGKLEKATVILGSATPSLESYQNALQGKYVLSKLSNRSDQAMAPVVLVDMRREFEKAKGFTLFSQRLIEEIKKRRALGEQTILLLNRRGYHTSCLCLSCGFIAKCPHCDLALTYHLGEKILACHLCDHRIHELRSCPSCKADETMKYKGAGTEMAERALHAVLPEVRTLRLDADTTRHKGSHEMIFRQFRSGKADVLIGTQMVAKGLHLPSVTLVGVLNADSSLNIPDFRAQEKCFQLITQVAGRAGRAELQGEVIVQTHMPEHEAMRLAASQNYEAFFEEEMKTRKIFSFPPFSHLAKVVFSGPGLQETLNFANSFRAALITHLPPSVELLPVAPCGHPKVQDRFRFQFLIKGSSSSLLSQKLKLVQSQLPSPGEIRTLIDINPETTFF